MKEGQNTFQKGYTLYLVTSNLSAWQSCIGILPTESHLFGLGKSIMIYCNLICNSFSQSIHYHLVQAWVTAIQPLQNPWKHQGAPRFYFDKRLEANFFHHLILFPLRKDNPEFYYPWLIPFSSSWLRLSKIFYYLDTGKHLHGLTTGLVRSLCQTMIECSLKSILFVRILEKMWCP